MEETIKPPEDFGKEMFPAPAVLTPTGRAQQRPKEYTGYPFHQEGGRGFKKGHPKLGGKKKGYKHFKTRFIEELENTSQDDRGVTVRNDLAITRKAIELARKGDLRAIEFIIERVDGKVPNIIAGSEDNPLTIIVESVIADRYAQGK